MKKHKLRLRTGGLIAENDKEAIIIAYLARYRKKLSHHFTSDDCLEIYKSTQVQFSQVRRANNTVTGNYARGGITTRRIKRKKINYLICGQEKPCRKFVLINKYPNRISDETKKEDLYNGDMINRTDTQLYDIKSFLSSGNML